MTTTIAQEELLVTGCHTSFHRELRLPDLLHDAVLHNSIGGLPKSLDVLILQVLRIEPARNKASATC